MKIKNSTLRPQRDFTALCCYGSTFYRTHLPLPFAVFAALRRRIFDGEHPSVSSAVRPTEGVRWCGRLLWRGDVASAGAADNICSHPNWGSCHISGEGSCQCEKSGALVEEVPAVKWRVASRENSPGEARRVRGVVSGMEHP